MEQIINMIMRQITRRFVNIGIDKSISAVSRKKKRKAKSDDQKPPLR